jgi:hypothetical protein
LIEVIIALFIVAFMLLALSAAMVHSVTVNFGNELRNLSVKLTGMTAAALLASSFDSITSCGLTADPAGDHYSGAYSYSAGNTCLGEAYTSFPNPVQSIKGFREPFNIVWNVVPLGDDLRQITLSVSCRHGGQTYSNTTVVYRHRRP